MCVCVYHRGRWWLPVVVLSDNIRNAHNNPFYHVHPLLLLEEPGAAAHVPRQERVPVGLVVFVCIYGGGLCWLGKDGSGHRAPIHRIPSTDDQAIKNHPPRLLSLL